MKVKGEVYKHLQSDAGGSGEGLGLGGVRENCQFRDKLSLTLSTSQQKVKVLLKVLVRHIPPIALVRLTLSNLS